MSVKVSFATLFLVVVACVSAATLQDRSRSLELAIRPLSEKSHRHHLLVEEVDTNGRGVVKELELPEYEDSDEAREDETRRREQRRELGDVGRRPAGGGCVGSRDEPGRRRCLKKWRRRLRASYRRWREAMRRLMRDVDARVRSLRGDDPAAGKG